LVSAFSAPSRPVHDVVDTGQRGEGENSEEPADLVGDSGISRRVRWEIPLFVPGLFAGTGGGEIGRGEHRKGDVGVPGPPGSDLVVVESGFVFRGLEALLDRPPGS
jgi:hypothetical protein